MEAFVVRLFRSDPHTDSELRGHLEHVASGVSVTFHTTVEMVDALSRLVTEPIPKHPVTATPRDA